ncbi:hypothetical protein AG1IA_01461 [Rhizoctonia solani AG-1 IA]|uniref:Uncharacterized protein n=1 Tax=Thanatephorus cucumeris (strain AG1-IA) TaxID=983506 RepID=L8X785_THACA|nr:hypothetical protein AG1IA_01461 [Rhizoctonia solani AG-1 IA]
MPPRRSTSRVYANVNERLGPAWWDYGTRYVHLAKPYLTLLRR